MISRAKEVAVGESYVQFRGDSQVCFNRFDWAKLGI